MYGIMKNDAVLLGTQLTLQKGEIVKLFPAKNLPEGGYFAKPDSPKGIWLNVSTEDSIYFKESEVKDNITIVNKFVDLT